MIWYADDIAGEGLIGGDARAGKEELRRRQADLLARPHQLGLHAAFQCTGANPHEGDAVTVIWVHIGLDLEHKGRHFVLCRVNEAGIRFLVARTGGESAETLNEVAHTEIAQGGAEIDGCQVALAKRAEVERPAGLARQFQFLDESLPFIVRKKPGNPI